MQIKEEVALIEKFMDDPLCKKSKEPEKQGWKCRIGHKKNNLGELGLPTSTRLRKKMGKTAYSKGTVWNINKCTKLNFPPQYHHLIPKSHLPDHPVCVWLAEKAKNGEWQLTESTNYDTDDARNGIALPNAVPTSQWKDANGDPVKQAAACNKLMERTGLQLHQGDHTYDDYGEGDDADHPGYLGAVDELLDVIDGQTMNHYEACEHCKKTKKKPIKIRPLERVALSMHQASKAIERIIKKNKRFVSERAAAYFGK